MQRMRAVAFFIPPFRSATALLCTPPSAFPFQRDRQQTSCLLFRFLSPVYPNVLHLLVRCLHLRDKQAPAHSA